MREQNPIVLGTAIEDTVRRYLESALPIHRNYPRLRKAIRRELRRKDLLLKGPFVEALPDFQKGSSLRIIVESEDAYLHAGFGELPELEYTRKLHKHQEQALQCIVRDGQNAIVATGTGSGKTECFLYPILNALLEEEHLTTPGVRALIVYPLNALANDQLYRRIVPLFIHQYKDTGITVGRYTGQTRQGVTRANAEQLLDTMHAHGNHDSLVYWLEFKDDEELPARFGSIAGGSALKFGLYRSAESGEWMTGHPTGRSQANSRTRLSARSEQH